MTNATTDRIVVDCLSHPDPKAVMLDFAKATPRAVLQMIQTRFVPPTDTEGSRYSALSLTHYSETATVGADYSLCSDENALAAALQLLLDHTVCRWVLIGKASTEDGWIFTFEAQNFSL